MHNTNWIDRTAYPFTSHFFTHEGSRIHYVDEGQGQPIVMVHGTPTWSFLYRDLIKALAPHYRCIAPDHLGFGLSDKPPHAGYRPADHARRLRALIDHLGLERPALVVHDFGGPIGLSYAIEQPQNVRALILFNTWMWSLKGEPVPELAGISGRGRIGKLLFQQLNTELRVLFRLVWGKPSRLRPAIYKQYLGPFHRPVDRQAIQTFAYELHASGAWYETLWQQRDRISNIPALLAWGLKDPLFTTRHLKRFQSLFTHARTITLPDVGHYVPEEASERLGPLVGQFLTTEPERG